MDNNEKLDLLFDALKLQKNETGVMKDHADDMASVAHQNRIQKDHFLSEIGTLLLGKKVFGGGIDFSENELVSLINNKIVTLLKDLINYDLIKSKLFENVETVDALDIEAKLEYIKSHSFSDSEITKIKADAMFEGFQKGLVEGMVISREEIKNNFPIYNFPLRGKILKTLTRLIKQTLKEQNAGNS